MSTLYLSETSIRIALAALGLVSVFFAPWWVPLICMLVLSVCYPAWEVLVIALVMDLVWLPGTGFELPLFLIGGIALVWICAPLRSRFLRP